MSEQIDKLALELVNLLDEKMNYLEDEHKVIAKFILDNYVLKTHYQSDLKDQNELLSLIDGCIDIVEIWKAESPAQIEWQKNWLCKATEAVK
jgi:hypothetical protein